ncbi:hypothetical protein AMATHDRAFT_3112 [Amanita thiersii Skay4041]|uniref:Threonylcarbamoyl-AMP synthase n=1 Tax=Amanita thiersii Skay4041 TaxID=703135 RepID=A0A2A9NT37_9AGAR|nr:hypothetical protein AMATHDRAFT_3112 [Amanita thiersii Skay4041]
MTHPSTRLLPCDPSSISFSPTSDLPSFSSFETYQALLIASRHLLNHQPVAFPTETVYGLGALALDAPAVSRIFSTKGRPSDNPLIVHVSSFSMLHSILPDGYQLPRSYEVLIDHFWPGPLTLLFPRKIDTIPNLVTADQPTVAIRMPSHPVARALIAVANAPLAAPSANSSGKPSPTKAEHVLRDLNGKLDIILDGGPCGVGLESTVIDGLHEDGNIRVLRPGGVTVEELERILLEKLPSTDVIPKVLVHRRDYTDELIEQAPSTPGMKYRHYSPTAPVTLLHTLKTLPNSIKPISFTAFLKSLQEKDSKQTLSVGVLAPADSLLWDRLLPDCGLEWHRYTLGPIGDPSITARRLFDGLLTLDNEGVDLILIEEVEEKREGLAIMNRVRKAAGESRWIILD